MEKGGGGKEASKGGIIQKRKGIVERGESGERRGNQKTKRRLGERL